MTKVARMRPIAVACPDSHAAQTTRRRAQVLVRAIHGVTGRRKVVMTAITAGCAPLRLVPDRGDDTVAAIGNQQGAVVQGIARALAGRGPFSPVR